MRTIANVIRSSSELLKTLSLTAVLVMTVGAATQALAKDMHAQFVACTYCKCQTSEPMAMSLPVGRAMVKLRIEGWSPTSHTGYPAWLYYQGMRRDKSGWTGWSESLVGGSEDRIKFVRGKITPEKPKPGDTVIFESEYITSAPVDIEVMISSQNWHDGSGACHQKTSEHWLSIESDGAAIQGFDPGRVWNVEEPDFQGGTWRGTWTRRGDSMVFDAYWRHSTGREHRDVLEFRGGSGGNFTIYRRGNNGTYSGRIGTDQRSVLDPRADWYPPGQVWKGGIGSLSSGTVPGLATVQGFDPGRVWNVEEPDFQGGTWRGTWTRRGDSMVFDAYWRHSTGREHRDVLEFRGGSGGNFTIYRRGNNGTYSGRIGTDQRSVLDPRADWYPSGQVWKGGIGN